MATIQCCWEMSIICTTRSFASWAGGTSPLSGCAGTGGKCSIVDLIEAIIVGGRNPKRLIIIILGTSVVVENYCINYAQLCKLGTVYSYCRLDPFLHHTIPPSHPPSSYNYLQGYISMAAMKNFLFYQSSLLWVPSFRIWFDLAEHCSVVERRALSVPLIFLIRISLISSGRNVMLH